MRSLRRRKVWLGGAIALLVLAAAIGTGLLNPRITRYVEGPEFRARAGFDRSALAMRIRLLEDEEKQRFAAVCAS